jgi:DNA-binding MarR family transcriptional regulator
VPGYRLRLQDLAAASLLSRSRISRMVRVFEQRGWVERQRAEDDGRGWYAILTPPGLAWLARCEPSYASSGRRHALSSLDAGTVQTVTAAASRLAAPVAAEDHHHDQAA